MVEVKRDNGEDEDYRRREDRLKQHAEWVEKHKIFSNISNRSENFLSSNIT